MPITEHTQNLHAHMDSLEAHHAKLGEGVNALYEMLSLATELFQKLSDAYVHLQGAHADMHEHLQGARHATSSIHEEASAAAPAG
jgi:hypothetical protein